MPIVNSTTQKRLSDTLHLSTSFSASLIFNQPFLKFPQPFLFTSSDSNFQRKTPFLQVLEVEQEKQQTKL